MGIDLQELKVRFTYRAPKDGQQERFVWIRDAAGALAQLIVGHTPESREQSLAITYLEQCVFWANAAIARRE